MTKLLSIALFLAVAVAYAPSDGYSQRPISLVPFSHTLTRAALEKLLGPKTLLDSVFEREGKNIDHKVLVFAPIQVMGFKAVARARMSGDSVDKIEFVLPYREHKNAKPTAPYADHGFVLATVDDLTTLRNNLTKEFGEPSIMSQTFFEYLSSKGVPSIRAQFRDRSITMIVSASGVL